METTTVVLTVSATEAAEASKATGDLQQELTRRIEKISVQRKRDDKETLDAGTVLVAVLGTKFVVELAVTLHDWLLRNNRAEITIDGKKISGKNLSLEQVKAVVEVALGRIKE